MLDLINKTAFVDIETVSEVENFTQLNETKKNLWIKLCSFTYKDHELSNNPEALWKEKAALHPEFAKIIAISVGLAYGKDNKTLFRIKPFYGDDEKKILTSFHALVSSAKLNFDTIVAHNGRKFDFPFICKRSIVNGVRLSPIFNIVDQKPWDVRLKDTMEMWNSGGYGYPSLDLVCSSLGVNLKSIMHGNEVHDTYYKDKNLEKIAKYCAADVASLVQIYIKIKQFNLNIDQFELAEAN